MTGKTSIAKDLRYALRGLAILMVILTAPTVSGTALGQSAAPRGGDEPGNLQEPSKLMSHIEERTAQKDSVFPVSPLGWLRDGAAEAKKELHKETGFSFAAAFAHVFQGITDSLPGTDDWGTATTADFIGTLDLINKGKATMGQVIVHPQARWQYGRVAAPEDLGFVSLASVGGTADTFSEYKPTFVLRNLYWRQGSPEAGWVYRLGKITPDGIMSSSAYLDSQITFLPSASVSSLAIGFPDSGWGAVGAWYFHERMALAGLVSDANADRFDFGDIGEGDLFKAAEFLIKVAPKTPKAGYSKITLWHTDGTKDGKPINASTGESGWGIFAKYEQELTADGRAIAILRYGKGFDDSAFYDQQVGAHFLLHEPRLLTGLKNDLVGAAFNWAEGTTAGARDEYNIELFYRFPIFPEVDMTLSYQSVINPALTRDIDHAPVFSLRIRTVF